MTTAFLKQLPGAKKKRSKYGNKITKYGDLTFHSKAELKRWTELEQLQRAGKIMNLRRQVPFDLIVNDVHITIYVADFVYFCVETTVDLSATWVDIKTKWGSYVVEDVKGGRATQTADFRIKRKLMKACHNIDILVTGNGT